MYRWKHVINPVLVKGGWTPEVRSRGQQQQQEQALKSAASSHKQPCKQSWTTMTDLKAIGAVAVFVGLKF
jgi:spore germination protein YaaH